MNNDWNDIKYALYIKPKRDIKAYLLTDNGYDSIMNWLTVLILCCLLPFGSLLVKEVVVVILGVLGVSAHLYYRWYKEPTKPRSLSAEEREAIDRAFWNSVHVEDDGFEEMTQEQFNSLTLDQQAAYTSKLANIIEGEWIEGLPANRQGPFAVPYTELTPEQQKAVDNHYLKLRDKLLQRPGVQAGYADTRASDAMVQSMEQSVREKGPKSCTWNDCTEDYVHVVRNVVSGMTVGLNCDKHAPRSKDYRLEVPCNCHHTPCICEL